MRPPSLAQGPPRRLSDLKRPPFPFSVVVRVVGDCLRLSGDRCSAVARYGPRYSAAWRHAAARSRALGPCERADKGRGLGRRQASALAPARPRIDARPWRLTAGPPGDGLHGPTPTAPARCSAHTASWLQPLQHGSSHSSMAPGSRSWRRLLGTRRLTTASSPVWQRAEGWPCRVAATGEEQVQYFSRWRRRGA